MSAKRRTTPFVSGRPSPSAIACASVGLELPAISLMEPFLADIEAAPRTLLETLFSISGFPGSGALTSEEIQAGGAAGNPQGGVFPGKNRCHFRDLTSGRCS